MGKPLLNLRGNNPEHYGYGRMIDSLRNELSRHVEFASDAEVALFGILPDVRDGWLDGQRKAVISMWETDTIPEDLWRFLYLFDTVIVTCEHNRELFSKYHANVHTMLLGVDRELWHPKEREPNKQFRIACGGSHWYRKGLDLVLDVFNELALPDAVLEIKSTPADRAAPKEVDYPNVTVHKQWMSQDEEVAWVRSADLFVAASRGEGFGMMPLQAISAGIPTAVTDRRGQAEFAHLATHRLSAGLSDANGGHWAMKGMWDEPNRDELKAAILDVYRNRETFRAQAVATAPLTAVFSWKASATRLLDIIKPTTKRVTGKWVVPPEVRVNIRVNKRAVADIGAHSVDLCVGKTHNVVLNVRDVLQEGGYIEWADMTPYPKVVD